MIATLRRLDAVPFAAWLAVGTVLSCASLPSRPQETGDVVRDLRAAVRHAEAGLPLARLGCEAIRHADERASCLAVASTVEAALPRARDVLARVDACAHADDEPACVALAVDGANVLLRALQGHAALSASASASASAIAPVASGAP